jgi:hypothetical protein
MSQRIARFALAATVAAALGAPTTAHAFCGFYVGGGGAALFNNATQVVLMRQGTRTVLSMQNNYQGPPTDFAMVVPVPVVLQEGDVKTLPRAVFEKVDQMGSPRLVEYWEQDPCAPDYYYDGPMAGADHGDGRLGRRRDGVRRPRREDRGQVHRGRVPGAHPVGE